jgi:hypothetical protein
VGEQEPNKDKVLEWNDAGKGQEPWKELGALVAPNHCLLLHGVHSQIELVNSRKLKIRNKRQVQSIVSILDSKVYFLK